MQQTARGYEAYLGLPLYSSLKNICFSFLSTALTGASVFLIGVTCLYDKNCVAFKQTVGLPNTGTPVDSSILDLNPCDNYTNILVPNIELWSRVLTDICILWVANGIFGILLNVHFSWYLKRAMLLPDTMEVVFPQQNTTGDPTVSERSYRTCLPNTSNIQRPVSRRFAELMKKSPSPATQTSGASVVALDELTTNELLEMLDGQQKKQNQQSSKPTSPIPYPLIHKQNVLQQELLPSSELPDEVIVVHEPPAVDGSSWTLRHCTTESFAPYGPPSAEWPISSVSYVTAADEDTIIGNDNLQITSANDFSIWSSNSDNLSLNNNPTFFVICQCLAGVAMAGFLASLKIGLVISPLSLWAAITALGFCSQVFSLFFHQHSTWQERVLSLFALGGVLITAFSVKEIDKTTFFISLTSGFFIAILFQATIMGIRQSLANGVSAFLKMHYLKYLIQTILGITIFGVLILWLPSRSNLYKTAYDEDTKSIMKGSFIRILVPTLFGAGFCQALAVWYINAITAVSEATLNFDYITRYLSLLPLGSSVVVAACWFFWNIIPNVYSWSGMITTWIACLLLSSFNLFFMRRFSLRIFTPANDNNLPSHLQVAFLQDNK